MVGWAYLGRDCRIGVPVSSGGGGRRRRGDSADGIGRCGPVFALYALTSFFDGQEVEIDQLRSFALVGERIVVLSAVALIIRRPESHSGDMLMRAATNSAR